MSAEQIFAYANLLALVGWLPLLVAPLRRPACLAAARWVAAILAGAYATMIILSVAYGSSGPAADFTTLAGLTALFSRPEVLLIGWVHYLAFDLWVGSWIAEDAPDARIGHGLVAPCLILTFVVGPVGLMTYLVLRTVRSRRA